MNDLSSFEVQEVHTRNEVFYTGSIDNYELNGKLEFYGFQLECKQDFTFRLNSDNGSAIHICINLAEKFPLSLDRFGTIKSIPSYTSLLIPFKEAANISFKFECKKVYDFIILKMGSSHLSTEQLELLKSMEDDNLFLKALQSPKKISPNLAVCEIARKLKHIDKASCENKFIASGYGYILMGLKLKEFQQNDINSGKLSYLRSYEIKQLEVLTQQINENPQEQFSIKNMCKQTGLSVSKLQAGFKDMHKCTVAIFIRNVRLERALKLLRTTDLNISEIVYSVGLNSRSYFCRIFKKKFKCSPKYYQQRLRQSVTVAS